MTLLTIPECHTSQEYSVGQASHTNSATHFVKVKLQVLFGEEKKLQTVSEKIKEVIVTGHVVASW